MSATSAEYPQRQHRRPAESRRARVRTDQLSDNICGRGVRLRVEGTQARDYCRRDHGRTLPSWRVAALSDELIAFLPTGRAISPVTGTDWEGAGVTPDLSIEAEHGLAAAHRAALRTLLDDGCLDQELAAEADTILAASD